MSTEWVQILIVCAVYVVLVVAAGRYLVWRRWDRERRINRQARLEGLRMHHGNPGFSVKV